MDRFVTRYKQQLQDNPNAINHLNHPSNAKTKTKISNYFKIKTKNKPNEISIDCSSDENEDDDIQTADDPSEYLQLLSTHNRKKQSINMIQKSLTQFLKNTDEIMTQNMKQKTEQQQLEYNYLYIPTLMNQRHLFELTELSGLRNSASAQRLSRICSQTVCNINSDILYRRNLHLIINNANLHRLPIRHSMNGTSLASNDCDYISSVKFDKMGSLFAAASTNGKIGIFDFDNFQTKWNHKARIPYNEYVMKSQRENNDKLAIGDDDTIVDIKADVMKNAATMENVMEICIDTQFRIEDMEWSHNMNDIAVCGHNGGCVNIYDLRRLSNKPKYRLKTYSKGHHPLLSIKYSTQRTLIMSGDRMGAVYAWDLKNKTSKPSLQFNAISKQTSLIGNKFNSNVDGRSMSQRAVKHLSVSSDGLLLYVVRENGYIQIMDIRKPGHTYKTIDLWRCSFDDDDNNIKKNKNKNVSFYDQSFSTNISTSHRARIDDAIILPSMNTALLKLQNNSLVNVHLETNTIRKTYSDHNNNNRDTSSNQQQAVNVAFLSKVMQRRMCSFENYGMPEMIVSGSFNKEMVVMDLSTQLDAHYADQEYRQKRVDLGLLDKDTSTSAFRTAKREGMENDEKNKVYLNDKSYGFMGYCELSDILTSCCLHPKSLYTVCGTLNNCLEIVACASNPF